MWRPLWDNRACMYKKYVKTILTAKTTGALGYTNKTQKKETLKCTKLHELYGLQTFAKKMSSEEEEERAEIQYHSIADGRKFSFEEKEAIIAEVGNKFDFLHFPLKTLLLPRFVLVEVLFNVCWLKLATAPKSAFV